MNDAGKSAYEMAAALAESMDSDQKEQFVELLKMVCNSASNGTFTGVIGVRQWMRHAGWGER